jgi:glycosyltransferase involved in cell wall biosynthesis
MKVAVFTETYHQLNGVGRTYQNMVDYARRKGYELDVYVPGNGSVEEMVSATIYNIPVEAGIEYYPDLIYDAAAVPRFVFKQLPEIIEMNFSEKEYDIAQIGTPGSIGLFALLAAKKFDVPLVGSYHTQVPNYARARVDLIMNNPNGVLKSIPDLAMEATWLTEKFFYGNTVFNMAPTNMICREIEARFNRPTRVFRRGVDTERFHPSNGTRPEVPTILFVSRIAVEKNIEMLSGFKENLPYARLVVVGDGPDRKRMEKLIPEADYRGFLTGKPLEEAFASAHAFVFPSVTETYGNVVQEAMASGLPVVVDASGPTSELVENGICGFHYDSRSEMFRQLDLLLKDNDLNLRMSRAARSAMEKRTWDSVFDSVYEGYEMAVRIHSKKPKSIGKRWKSRMEEIFGSYPKQMQQA